MDTNREEASELRGERRRGKKRIPRDAEQITVYAPRELVEAARNAVVATSPFEGGYQGLSALVVDAIGEKVGALQDRFNDGEPFPPRRTDLRRGRPMG